MNFKSEMKKPIYAMCMHGMKLFYNKLVSKCFFSLNFFQLILKLSL